MTARGEPGEAARAGGEADTMLLNGQSPALVRVSRFANGAMVSSDRHAPAPLGDERELQEVAQGKRAPFIADREIEGNRMRVFVSRGPNDLGIFVARPLGEVDSSLRTLRWALGLLALAGIALAVVLSRLATRTAIRPVVELTETAEHVATSETCRGASTPRGRTRCRAWRPRSTPCSSRLPRRPAADGRGQGPVGRSGRARQTARRGLLRGAGGDRRHRRLAAASG